MKVYRPALIRDMQKANRELLDEQSDWDEILFYLIDKFRPSFKELRDALHSLQRFIRVGRQQSEAGLLAEQMLRGEIRTFNYERKFDQLIGTEKQDWQIMHPKTGKPVMRKAFLLGLAIGDIAQESDDRHAYQIKRLTFKRKNLKDRIDKPTHYRAASR